MRNKMNKLAERLKTMYLTENPINFNDNDHGYKYFICFHNTHTIAVRTKSISDMIYELENIIENGFHVDSHTFY